MANEDDMDLLRAGLGSLGYEETADPWMLPNTHLTLRRFLKVEGQDELMIDLLPANDDEHLRVIRDAVPAESTVGAVPVATRQDIIWMKKSRNSEQDRVDISELEEDDKDREGSKSR